MQATNLNDFLAKAPQAKQLAIALKSDEERAALWRFIISKLKKSQPDLQLLKEGPYSPSLFGGKPLMLIDPVAKQKPESFDPSLSLLLGAKTVAPLKKFEQALLLNLEKESFRAREERYIQFVLNEMRDITSEAAALLVQNVGIDLEMLIQEMEKLNCYGKKPIDRDAILDLVPKKEEMTLWKISEEIVFERKLPAIPKLDTRELLILIGQLRSHLETGLKIKELDGQPLSSHFPTIRDWILDRYVKLSARLPTPYFQKGLFELVELELKSKSTTVDPKVLLDHFLVQWQAN